MQVSVIIPCYNSGDWLESTVLSAANQTLPPLEILCVNDASENDTAERLARLKTQVGERLRLFTQPQREGIGAARNRGLSEACGDWVALLDHDDLWLPDKLEKQSALAARVPDAALLHSRCLEEQTGHSDARSLMHQWKWPWGKAPLPYLFLSNFIVPCTVLLRSDVLREAGGFEVRADRHGKDDIELWLRLATKRHTFAFLDEPLAVRRLHDRNYSSDSATFLQGRYNVLLEAFERDRMESRELLISEGIVRLLGILFDQVSRNMEAPNEQETRMTNETFIHFLESAARWNRGASLAERLAIRFPAIAQSVSMRARKNRRHRLHHVLESALAGGAALTEARKLARMMETDDSLESRMSPLASHAAEAANRAARRAYRRRAQYEQTQGAALITRS